MRLKGFFLLMLVLSMFVVSIASAETRIRCASTTSTQNSGLFDYILPIFEKKTGIKVDVVAVGTGAALEIGKRGDCDVVFVHAKDDELRLVKEGYFINRHDVMYNDFIIVGPPNDPARIKGLRDAVQAFKRIAQTGSFFTSRGDNSGTNKKEVAIWKKAGIEPKGQRWYLATGSGMEKTLRVANEKVAYCLTDRGTWLATRDRDKFDMVILVEGDPVLFNQYGVMIPNPKQHPWIKFKEAMEFLNWLISKDGQKTIASYKDKHGNTLFIPDAK